MKIASFRGIVRLGAAMFFVLGLVVVGCSATEAPRAERPIQTLTDSGDPYVAADTGQFRAPNVSTNPVAVEPGQTVISLTFDDGFEEDSKAASILSDHGLRGTFFVNSGNIGKPGYIGLDALRGIASDGHEIGGHTVLHRDLTALSPDEARRDICIDRVTLLRWGFQVRNFAYPFAAASPDLLNAVAGCGYNSGRSLDELRSPTLCPSCPASETIPPETPYFTKASSQAENTWTLADFKQRVQDAQQKGGWLQLTFHRLCTEDCNRIAVTDALFNQFVSWLATKNADGSVLVRTVGDVIGGPVQEPIQGPLPPAVTVGQNALKNPQLETQTAPGQPDCWLKSSFGDNRPTFSDAPGAGGTGVAQRIVMTDYVDGDAKLIPSLDLGDCAPSVVAGNAYDLEASYTSTVPTRFAVYYRLARGVWVYWMDSAPLPPAGTWSRARWTTPPVPAAATALSFGLSLTENGELVSDDHAFFDATWKPSS
ncbi:polysaccharide deacetylase family protein [Antrihabitans sp. YC3-6]|uniref:Polysaccharide deacetylase family protein n=1 Tax=Antrihabitans stalagmiti TaxID=2799499 RepID=A0A934U1B4_9NOCA|nr:polysaccharide deacetylase family protein [Antrihabitans stalagmiti]MBJ8337278.1 polysaccharide deacetylase family protein [Antrihabitans stalagmiti]